METSLSGKVAVVTGASRGIGRRMAQALAAAGARVALFARASAQLDAMQRELGENALAVACDVSDPTAVKIAFGRTVEHFGRIDVLVNNAGICLLHKLEAASDTELRNEIDVNLLGPILCSREAIAHLRAAGGGDIVNVSSESVRLPFPYLTVYAATKGGLETFSAGLRSELRADGIRVTVLRAGNTDESSIASGWPEALRNEYLGVIEKSGHLAFTGVAASPQTLSRALVNVLTLPRDVNVDMIEVRAL